MLEGESASCTCILVHGKRWFGVAVRCVYYIVDMFFFVYTQASFVLPLALFR